MLINHDLQDLRTEVAYRRDAMQRAAAGNRRRRRPERRWKRADAAQGVARIPGDG